MQYLEYLPADYGADPGRPWPLILFLHGAEERGDDLSVVTREALPRLLDEGLELPFVVVAPQCPAGMYWEPDLVGELVDHVAAVRRVDRTRLYLTGISMGGFGTWATAIEYPDFFAAIIPICGGGDPERVCAIAHVPVWTFHGDSDLTVPPARTIQMVRALERCGGKVLFTLYPNTGHDAWTATCRKPAVYEWLLQHASSRSYGRADESEASGKGS